MSTRGGSGSENIEGRGGHRGGRGSSVNAERRGGHRGGRGGTENVEGRGGYRGGRGSSGNIEGRGGHRGGPGSGRATGTDRGYGSRDSFFANPENWMCTCGYTNFPQRTRCNKCDLPRSHQTPSATSMTNSAPCGSTANKAGAPKSILPPRDPEISDFVRWVDAPDPKAAGSRDRTGRRPEWHSSKPSWNCPDPECNVPNWGHHTRCHMCGLCYPE